MRVRQFLYPSRVLPLATGLILVAVCSLAASGRLAAADEPIPVAGIGWSPFGIGSCYINNRSVQDNARWIPQMAAIGITNHRTCHTGWEAVEPEEGKWTWDELDKQMKYLEGLHIEFGAILAGNAVWNKKDQPGSLPVNNLPAWSRYVSQVAKHVKGKAKYFEVWNEPPNFTGRDQTPADYAKIVVSAYDAVKAIDSTCLVGLAAKSVHVNYLEQVIKAGAKDHFDFITLHPYEVLGGIADNIGSEALYMSIVPTVRKMLAAQNPAKRNVPIIFTELGAEASKSPEKQALALVKAYTMGIAQGVACIQWFEGRDGDSGPMGLLDEQGKPRPSYQAMAQMIKHLGQHPTYLGWVLFSSKDYGFVFQGAKGTVLATWASRGTPDRVDFAQKVRVVDPLTGKVATASTHKLTTAPILVLGVPENLVTEAKANKRRPFPWGGDYTTAKSVSITMDGKYREKGLHTASGDDVATAVVAYGGAARAGNIPGGNVFMVDPNFLSYTATPIEVTLVVRRNPANDNAGFKLVYESTDGYKNFGWYTVPDNKKWHTVKWKINDAQFVGMWGYNFSLDSDGNEYNKYFIQSVTVTKLAK
jgi:polysaccharide biosynthesis protein PslG